MELMNYYDLPKINNCEFLTRGLNDSYLITTRRDNYIFRIYRHNWRTENDILFELGFLCHLKEYGQHVATPIKTKDDAWLINIDAPEGIRYGVLFTYAKGQRPEINEEDCLLMGKSLGLLHNCSDTFKHDNDRSFSLNFDHLLNEPLSVISPIIHNIFGEEQVQFLEHTTTNIINELKNRNLDYGICHGDFHNFNMHLSNRDLEVFDFDCCGYGYRAYDIAVFWWNLKSNYPQLEEDCWKAFLKGYRSQRSLSEEDMKSLPLFVTARRIWLVGTMINNDDVWGRNWINQSNLTNFLKDLKKDIGTF